MKPTLLVLAAGMGSRYGGLKQLDGLGPNGETIMDYSIYDALQAGFGKVVFVIRKDFEQDFREKILSKYENHIAVEVVFQDINALPEGYTAPADRTRPWGTNHAVLMGADVVREPFTVINADDYYGIDAYQTIYNELVKLPETGRDFCNAFSGGRFDGNRKNRRILPPYFKYKAIYILIHIYFHNIRSCGIQNNSTVMISAVSFVAHRDADAGIRIK